jgi:predicted nuclease of restriction endonuclease-like (RecB) superfamily
MNDRLTLPSGYSQLLEEIAVRISTSQIRAALGVSRELVLLYWSIGREILARQESEGWGAKVIDRLGRDLQARFPGVEGFSPRNLKYMRSLAQAWPDASIVPQRVALLPWGHLRLLLDRVKEPTSRQWYLQAALEHGWSRDVLAHMISGQLYERQGKALTNFRAVLPPADSDMAEQVLRDPYNGSQVSLPVGDQTFYPDLLFYHVRLHCYFVIELKTGEFKPEYAGKLNFYLSAVDGILKTDRDDPTIGLLLCETKNEAIVELSFKNVQKPIGISTYTVTRELPPGLEQEMPSIEDLKGVVEKLRTELEVARKADMADPSNRA